MTLPYYPFYWGDYSAKTFNLTVSQHGAYMLLLRHVYCGEGRIPDEKKYEITKAITAEDKLNVDYVLAKFWLKKNGSWWNEKAEEVMKKQDKIHQANVNKGKKGGRPTKPQLKPNLSPDKAEPKQLEPELEPNIDMIRLDSAREKVDLRPKPVDQFAILEKQLREAAGWQSESHPNLFIIGPVATVLTLGVDLDLDLLPAARAHGPRLTNRTSWKYILQAAISNRDNRLGMATDASKPIQPNGRHHANTSKPEFIHPATVAANKLRAKLGIESDSGQTRHDSDDWIEGDYTRG